VSRNINKIDESSTHFKKLNLTYSKRLKGFDPNGIFREHLLGVGFNTSFIHTHLTQDRNSVDNNPTSVDCDPERLQSTTELYRQHGKVYGEKSTIPPPTLPRARHHGASLRQSTPVRKKPRNIRMEEEIRTLLA
jgi:hypothetical protein